MRTQTKLLRLITPPPVAPGNLIVGQNLHSVTDKALSLHLSKSVPTSTPRHHAHKINLVTVHPSQPLIAYLIVPEGPEKKTQLKSIIVQHAKTRKVIWHMSLGEMASTLFDYDVLSKTAKEKQAKILKDLGKVLRLDFLDPSTLYWSGHTHGDTDRWSYLFVQFTNRLLVVNLRKASVHIAQAPISKPLQAHITQESLSAMIASNAMPVSQHVILVGTSDGTLKVYDWHAKRVLKTVQNLMQNKSDWIVHLESANKYVTPDQAATTTRRVVALTRKGNAYLIEIEMEGNTVKEVHPPMARFEGGSVPTSMSKAEDEHTSMEHIFVEYDAFRNLLLWCHPSKTKAKLLVWDLSNIPEPDEKQKKKGEIVKPDPTLVLQFPYETTHTIFPGWMNENVPSDSMTCLAVTKEGDFQMLVAPLYNSGSTMKNPFNAVTILSVSLPELVQQEMQLPEPAYVKVQSVDCPHLRDSSVFYLATNMGVLLVRMADGNLVPVPGARHAHLNANIGSFGKSVLSVKHSAISFGFLESKANGASPNPLGTMVSKSSMVVYESPLPLHLPPEIVKRPVRLPPCFLASPSRNYLCCFWKEEMRYEVLHVATMLQRVSSRSDSNSQPVVASGNGVSSFAWVGDEDVFCILYNPEQDLALKVGIDLSAPTASLGKEFANVAGKMTDLAKLKELRKFKELASAKAFVGTASKLKSLEGLRDLAGGARNATIGSVKGVTKLGMGSVKLTSKMAVGTVMGTTKVAFGTVKQTVRTTGKMTVGAVKAGTGAGSALTTMAVGGTNKVVGGATKGTKVMIGGVAKVATFGMLGKKNKNKQAAAAAASSLANAEADNEEEAAREATVAAFEKQGTIPEGGVLDKGLTEQLEKKHPWVEVRSLVSSTAAVEALGGSIAAATASNLGELSLRSGKRSPPTILFGGPVLCVACKLDEQDEGLAYFYTQKRGQDDNRASVYVSSGPAFPCPDLVAWDDDGRLCAVIIQNRVAIYLSDEPEFVMLGNARLGSSSDADVQVTSARFIHGVLYCTTRSSVQCIFLGDVDGGICHLDTFTLASSDVPTLPSKNLSSEYTSLTPPTLPMPLNHPVVLGYQNGSLMLSTVGGLQAIPLTHPLLRIGALLGAGQDSRAEKWFDAVPEADHEALATFLERRGAPELALKLSGVSLETTIDICMRYGLTDRLEEVVDLYGLKGLRAIDMGRGVSSNIFGPEENGTSLVVCVSAYLLSQGKVELVRRLATECLGAAEDSNREAFILASLLLSIKGSDAKRVLQRSVEDVGDHSDWMVGKFVREHVLSAGTDQ